MPTCIIIIIGVIRMQGASFYALGNRLQLTMLFGQGVTNKATRTLGNVAIKTRVGAAACMR